MDRETDRRVKGGEVERKRGKGVEKARRDTNAQFQSGYYQPFKEITRNKKKINHNNKTNDLSPARVLKQRLTPHETLSPKMLTYRCMLKKKDISQWV